MWIWLIWILLGGLLVLAELQTGTFYLLLLGIAALATGVLGLLGLSLTAQCVIFAVLTVVLYAFALPRIRKWFPASRSRIPTVTESLPGQAGKVEEAIKPGEVGQVKVNGELWSAIADEELQPGETVIVVEVRVSKLVVRKG